MFKKYLKKHFLGRRRYQPLWERLHSLSLAGMNIGCDGATLGAGEKWVLDYINRELSHIGQKVVFDVGANVGLYALEILQRFQNVQIYCFEPSRTTFELLNRTLSERGNVICNNIGLSDAEKSATLYSYAGQPGLSSVYDRFVFDRWPNPSVNKSKETIQLMTLDLFCARAGVSRINFLKLDVEGHELQVLQGAARLLNMSSIDFIQFEFGGTNLDSKIFLHDFISFLGPRYEVYRILRDGLVSIKPYAERNEIFLYSNYLAVLTVNGDNELPK